MIQQELDTATILVSHDLGVVARVADRVAIMYAGKIVEIGTAKEIFYDPRHPYTWGADAVAARLFKGTESSAYDSRHAAVNGASAQRRCICGQK